jgi:hypothetical protein
MAEGSLRVPFGLRRWHTVTRRIGSLLLGIWLVLTGLLALTNLSIPSREVVMAVLALLAGLFLLAGR